MPEALADDLLVGERGRDARGQRWHDLRGIDGRRQLLEPQQRMAEQIRDLHQRPAGADVDGDRAAPPRFEEQVLRLAAALGFALLALEDLFGVEQVLHEPADRAAPHAHQPRQFGARDRLAGAHEVERDLTVDLA